ncbi:MAG: 4-cyclodiphosphate synthase [Candidatus Tokpelaia sp. JSC188]|nr:MAG: 4-cyclodiphosphate synthase [Candidatus Tokpelaia sp. JSC188]
MSVAAIVLAAGRGRRTKGNTPKQYASIGGTPIIRRTIETFLSHGNISPIVLVIHPSDYALCQQALGKLTARVLFVEGGATRQDSARAGLRYLQQLSPHYVHIHDGARPFIKHELLDAIYSALTPSSGVLPAMPVSDTFKEADDNDHVIATIPYKRLFAAQTPQSFPYSLILSAHEAAYADGRHDFTDDSAIAEWYTIPMRVIEGAANNIKITWAIDIEMANKRLKEESIALPDVRTGNGYDVHKLEKGDGVVLCGVKIPCQKKLSGHSDADVALHALTDALLATQGAGDIGIHFPPSDPQWKGIASEVFVRHAVRLIRERKGHIANIDITVITEIPKISPYRQMMTWRLREMLGIIPERISIKATSNEMLGFIGRKEGIAAIATATVIYNDGSSM